MRFERTQSKCSECPLRGRNRVWGEGAENGKLVLMGEAPGAEEDLQGRPFVGPSGSFLNWALGTKGIFRFQQWTTNVLPCRPPSNDFGSFEAQVALEKCEPGFEQELEFLREHGYSVVSTLGGNAMNEFGIEGKVMKNRGSVYEERGFVVVPTLHPAALLRQQSQKQGGVRGGYKYVFIADLEKAYKIAQEGWNAPKELFNLSPSVEEVEEFVADALANRPLIACDIETSGKGKHSELVVVGLALDGERAISIPFFGQGRVPTWSNGKAKRVKDALSHLFSAGRFVFQYAPFDVPFLIEAGYPQELLYNVEHDTLVLHSVLNPELPHRLDFIVSEYGATPYWKEEFKTRVGSIYEMDDVEMRTYNLRDAVVLHQVLEPMLEELEKRHLEDVYFEERILMLPAIMQMKLRGIKVDERKIRKLKKDLTERKEEAEAKLRDVAGVPPAFNFDSGDDLGYLLYGFEPEKFKFLSQLSDFDEVAQRKRLCENEECKKRTFWGEEFCPKCGEPGAETSDVRMKAKRKVGTQVHQKLVALKEVKEKTSPLYMPPHFTPRSTDSGRSAADEQALLSLQVATQNRAKILRGLSRPQPKHEEEKEAAARLLSFLAQWRTYSELKKLLSTYTSYPTGDDGRVHADWLIHGTASGRISSKSPNLNLRAA